MRANRYCVFLVFLSFLPRSAGAKDSKESIDLGAVKLSLGMAKDMVLQRFEGNSVRQEGDGDYWIVSQGTGSEKWLGSILFKRGKSVLIVKSWGSPGDRMAKDFMAQMTPPRTDCQFVLAQTPNKNSPIKLTVLTCDPRRLAFQLSEDQGIGLQACEVEILGDPESRLNDVKFWKFCKGPTP
jgi:hypothetical protein